MKIRRKALKLKDFLLDIVFPRFCLSCNKEGKYLCYECTLFLSEASFICPICKGDEFFGKTHSFCKKRRGLDGLVSFWDYEGLLKGLICKTKYESLIDIPRELVEFGFYTARSNKKRFSYFIEFLCQEETVVTFVPLSKEKEKKRGFNQAEQIAKEVAFFAGKKTEKLLFKNKETKTQTSLNKEERRKNGKKTFSCNKKLVKKIKRVILIDDVWTSGATVEECARTLKKEGIKEIWALTIAKVA